MKIRKKTCYVGKSKSYINFQVDCLNATFQMCQDFLDGNVYLVPYDCDFSHAPCLGKVGMFCFPTFF